MLLWHIFLVTGLGSSNATISDIILPPTAVWYRYWTLLFLLQYMSQLYRYNAVMWYLHDAVLFSPQPVCTYNYFVWTWSGKDVTFPVIQSASIRRSVSCQKCLPILFAMWSQVGVPRSKEQYLFRVSSARYSHGCYIINFAAQFPVFSIISCEYTSTAILNSHCTLAVMERECST